MTSARNRDEIVLHVSGPTLRSRDYVDSNGCIESFMSMPKPAEEECEENRKVMFLCFLLLFLAIHT